MSSGLAFGLEWTAVVLNILFTILIGFQKRAGWLFGFVAAVISVILYQAQDAWLMALLNVFYGFMGIYGWLAWGHASQEKPITRFRLPTHLALLVIGAAGGNRSPVPRCEAILAGVVFIFGGTGGGCGSSIRGCTSNSRAKHGDNSSPILVCSRLTDP